MSDLAFPSTASDVARFLGAEVLGNPDRPIESLASLQSPALKSLMFITDKKFQPQAEKIQGATVLIRRDLELDSALNTLLIVENPKLSFAKIAAHFSPKNPWSSVSPLAQVHPETEFAEGVSVGPFAVICAGVRVGKGTVVFPHAYIGPGVLVGENCEIHPFVSLIANTLIGNRVKIFSGTVIGSEGFGFLEQGGIHLAMPQIGRVVIEDDVRIGAKCTIDRSTLGETRVGRGSKLDDQVHVGHNCIIGPNCILCGQVALGGSTVLEEGVILGGQVGLAGHLTVGKGAEIAGQSGTSFDLKGGERYFGSPCVPIREAFRNLRATSKVPEVLTRLKKLEEQFKDLT